MGFITLRALLNSGETVRLHAWSDELVSSLNIDTSKLIIDDDVSITLSDNVVADLIFTATVTGLDAQIVQSGSDTNIQASIFANGAVVEPYTAANWNWTIDADTSGGASFGGVDGDDLTVGPNVGSVTIRATYDHATDPANPANGTTQTATCNVVAAVVNNLEIYGPPNDVVENTSYQLFTRSRNGVTNEVINEIEPGVAYVVDSGPATITGANSDILTVNASITPPVTITVSVSKVGFTPDTAQFNGVEPAAFPDNQPPGMTGIEAINGSTKLFTGWTEDSAWLDNDRVSVVVDAASKFGNVVQKEFFVGDGTGWHGRTFHDIGTWTEMYVRIVFLLSNNYQFVSGGEFLMEYAPAQGSRVFNIALSKAMPGRIAWVDWTSNAGEYLPLDGSGDTLPAIAKNVYHTVEIHHIASITAGSGSLRFWFDNVEYTNFQRSFSGGETGPLTGQTWQATAPETDKRIARQLRVFQKIGGSKSVNDHVRISEIFVSGKA